jgi:major membrane immunogen (membrane-anchored lipoprotein)
MFIALLAGCSQLGDTSSSRTHNEGWSQIRMPSVSQPAAFDAGKHAVQQWFRIAEASVKDGQIRSVTTEFDQKGGTGRIRDAAIKYKNRMRHTATVYVESDGTGSIARCMVEVQRLDTADHHAFRDNTRGDDRPNQTPIDGEASLTAKQDQVWTDMPRDRQLEMDILNVLRAKAGGGQPASTSTPKS